MAEDWMPAKPRTFVMIALMIVSRQPVRSSAPPKPSAIKTSEIVHIIDWIPPRLSKLSISDTPVSMEYPEFANVNTS